MKRLLIAATLSAATIATTSLFADPGHQRGQRQAGATENCHMGDEHGDRAGHRAEMQNRMQEMHARMGTHEGRGMQDEHKH